MSATAYDPEDDRRIRIFGISDRPHYTRGSIERAMELHFPGRWRRRDGAVGYLVDGSGMGGVEIRTMREAALFVWAAAEKERALLTADDGSGKVGA